MTQRSSTVCDPDSPALQAHGRSRDRGARTTRISKTLFWYLARGLAVNSLVTFLILEAVQGVIFTVRATEGYSFDILIIFPVLVRAFAQAMTYTLPLSLLLGTSLLVGRLCAEREILALRSFGVSPLQASLPALSLGAVVAVLSWWLNCDWAPAMRFANRNAEGLLLNNLGYLGEGWNFSLPTSQFNLYVRHYDGPQVEDLFVAIGDKGKSFLFSQDISAKVKAPSYGQYLHARRGRVLRARSEQLGQPVIALEDVSLFVDDDFSNEAMKKLKGDSSPNENVPAPRAPRSSNFLQRIHFENLTWVLTVEEKDRTVKDMTGAQLAEESRRRGNRLAQAREAGNADAAREAAAACWHAQAEFHRRISLTLSVVLYPLAAFLLGLWVNSTNRLLPFFLASTILPSLYFLGELVGTRIAREGHVPWATQQIGNWALGVLIGALLWRLHAGPGTGKKRRPAAPQR